MTPANDNVPEQGGAETGSRQPTSEMLPQVYAELRRLAEAWMGQTPGNQTLQPTALVHEAFLRLVGRDLDGYENQAHFFFAASRAMRDILVERARSKASLKHGGKRRRVSLDELELAEEVSDDAMLALDEALTKFKARYASEHEIVMLRFFAGLTNEQTAKTLSATLRSVERDWQFARRWLQQELQRGEAES